MAKQRNTLIRIAMVRAADMPKDVRECLTDWGVEIHGHDDITTVEDDGNPFAEWLKASGYIFSDLVRDGVGFDYIAILST